MTTTNHYSLRPCTEDDFESVMPLFSQLWPNKPLDEAALKIVFERGLQSDSQIYRCAVKDGVIVGFASLTLKNNFWQEGYLAHMDELVVDEAHRKEGLGVLFVEEMASIARQHGCKRLELDSGFYREEAHKFYEKRNFEKRGYVFSKLL